jgi:hypothetical protein
LLRQNTPAIARTTGLLQTLIGDSNQELTCFLGWKSLAQRKTNDALRSAKRGQVNTSFRRDQLSSRSEMAGFALSGHAWKTIAGLLVAIGGALAGEAIYHVYQSKDFGECDVAVRSSIASPDGKRVIVIFEKQCGATVGFNTQVSIAPAGSPFSVEESPPFFVASDRLQMVVTWLGDRVIEISGIAVGAKIFKSMRGVGDVAIEYR